MTRITKALVAVVVGLGIFGSTMLAMNSCYTPTYYKARARATADVISVAKIDQAMLDEAWQKAIEVGGGDPAWALSVPLSRVVLVPSTLAIGPYQYYGITVTEPAFVNGKLVLVETIEIHLPANLQCHVKQVLIHELIHTVFTRRELADPNWRTDLAKHQNDEQMVRDLYPITDMGVCK